jgi:anti-sigma regulatory factor (Ser/Thr protein kinase)
VTIGVPAGAGAGDPWPRHEALIYGSDEELATAVVPFLRAGLAAGEPTLVVASPGHTALLRAAMPEAGEVVFLEGAASYPRPSGTISAYREMLSGYVAAGASRIRIAGELPRALFGATWWWWSRYEAAINHVYADFPLWNVCAYDTRTTPRHVLDDVRATHPLLVTAGGGHRRNECYRPRDEFLSGHAVTPDPLEATPPVIELAGEPAVTARHAVWDAEHAGLLPAAVDTEAVVLVVNEAVTNGIRHGQGPVRLRLWAGPERVALAVSDHGTGPPDPLAGLLPTSHPLAGEPSAHSPGGQGLWVIHELSELVTLDTAAGGYTLRATLGTPAA